MLPCISLYFHKPPCTSIKGKQQSIILWFKMSFNNLNHLFSPWLPLYFPVLPLYSHCTSGVRCSHLFFLGWTLILYRKNDIIGKIDLIYIRKKFLNVKYNIDNWHIGIYIMNEHIWRIYRYIHMNFFRSVTNQIKVPELKVCLL